MNKAEEKIKNKEEAEKKKLIEEEEKKKNEIEKEKLEEELKQNKIKEEEREYNMIVILKQNKIDRQKTMSVKERHADHIKLNEEMSKIMEERE
jgi:hypothetical protein